MQVSRHHRLKREVAVYLKSRRLPSKEDLTRVESRLRVEGFSGFMRQGLGVQGLTVSALTLWVF